MVSGKIGCTFAALFAKAPEKVNWITIQENQFAGMPADAAILSIQFPGRSLEWVLGWAMTHGFYIENLGEGCTGLRYKVKDAISWVQYFGPDSHVKTRQAPIPELCMALKLHGLQYVKVGFKGIIHLAHASISGLKNKAADILWRTSFENTERRLGHKPGLKEAAKTTFISR